MTRQWRLFEESVGRLYNNSLYLGVFDWIVQRFCWPKGTSFDFAESIYVKITEAACVYVCDEKMLTSLGDSRIKRVQDRIAILNMQTVRVVVLEYS